MSKSRSRKPQQICPRCFSPSEEGYDHCWVCYNNSKQVVYVAEVVKPGNQPYHDDEQHGGQVAAKVGATIASTLMIGLFMGLGSILLAIIIVMVIISSILTAIGEMCSGCTFHVLILGGIIWSVISSILSLISYFF